MKKKTLNIGITGHDASYLAELLIGKVYKVNSLSRRILLNTNKGIAHLISNHHVANNLIQSVKNIIFVTP